MNFSPVLIYWVILTVFFTGLKSTNAKADFLDKLETKLEFQEPLYQHKLSNPSVKATIIDSNGFLWIATEDGLNRFDGRNNVIFRPGKTTNNYISHVLTKVLFIDNNNTLWAGTENGLNRYNSNKEAFEFFPILDNNRTEIQNLQIRSIFEDSKNRLWVGTANSSLHLISNDRALIRNIDPPQILANDKASVKSIVESQSGQILVSSTYGLFQFNSISMKLDPMKFENKDSKILFSKNINQLAVYNQELLLLGTTRGLYSFNFGTNEVLSIASKELSEKVVTQISDFGDNQLLIGTRRSGIVLVNLKSGETATFRNSINNPQSLKNNQIEVIYRSENNVYWIGSRLGLNLINPSRKEFGLIRSQKSSNDCLPSNTIYSLLSDSSDNLWIGAFGASLVKILQASGECLYITNVSNSPYSKPLQNVVSMYEDETGFIWVATFRKGVYKVGPKTSISEYFDIHAQNEERPKLTTLRNITGNKNGLVWVSTFEEGIYEYNIETGHIRNIYPITPDDNTPIKSINSLAHDKKGDLWVATATHGLWHYAKYTSEFKRVDLTKNGKRIPANNISSVFIDSDENIWVGSKGEGLIIIDKNREEVEHYNIDNGLLSNIVLSTQIDNSGYAWLFTDKGLSRLDRKASTLRTYLQKDGLQDNAFTNTSSFNKKSGYITTGGINGFNHFKPEDLSPPSTNKTVITSFELFYEPVVLRDTWPESPLKKSIVNTNEIKLTHSQNVFAFSFSALEFIAPDNIKYRFSLDGYDKGWNTVNAERAYANYTNIPPGDYTFRVKSTNSFGEWQDNESTIKINILYPWWQTTTARLGFLLIFLLLIYYTIKIRTRALLKRAETLEKEVTNRTQELSEEKQKVEKLLSKKNEEFANVSHEFRTPLTLVLGPVAQLIEKANDETSIDKLNIIQRNGYRLLRMVDQLLNIETFRIKTIAKKSPQAIGKNTKLMCEAFSDLADASDMKLTFAGEDNINFEFTQDAYEKILLNLLSNAIKYSKPGAKITVTTVRTKNNEYHLSVKDTGIGIPADKIDSVFERYNRVMDENSEQVTGAGIGLALVKELVEAHQGSIKLQSKLGEGTQIDIYLPIINEVSDEEVATGSNADLIDIELVSLSNQKLNEEKSSEETLEQAQKESTVLVIEDNPDMRQYITNSLQDQYRVLTANNGKAGVELAISEVPDVIVSDIMMPVMDGYEATKAIRENEITSHIPLVLLTARGDRESRLRGWNEKADEYLTKPFDVEELRIRLANLLEIRNLLKKKFAETVFVEKTTIEPVEEIEEQTDIYSNKQKQQQVFVDKLNDYLKTHYSDTELTVPQISKAILMSERQFFRKLKSVVDLNPVEYLRRYRLERGKELLSQGLSTNRTAFDVGFSSQGYFGRCFKAQYGMSPSEYKKQLQS